MQHGPMQEWGAARTPLQGWGAHAGLGCNKDSHTRLECTCRSEVQHGPMQNWGAARTPVQGWGAQAGVGRSMTPCRTSMQQALHLTSRAGLGCACRAAVLHPQEPAGRRGGGSDGQESPSRTQRRPALTHSLPHLKVSTHSGR